MASTPKKNAGESTRESTQEGTQEGTEFFDSGLRVADLDPERPRPVETPWGSIALYLIDGEVLASDSFCPHMLGPLFQGTIAYGQVTCPWHGWRFDLRTGQRCDSADEGAAHARIRVCEVLDGAGGTLWLRRPRKLPRSAHTPEPGA